MKLFHSERWELVIEGKLRRLQKPDRNISNEEELLRTIRFEIGDLGRRNLSLN